MSHDLIGFIAGFCAALSIGMFALYWLGGE